MLTPQSQMLQCWSRRPHKRIKQDFMSYNSLGHFRQSSSEKLMDVAFPQLQWQVQGRGRHVEWPLIHDYILNLPQFWFIQSTASQFTSVNPHGTALRALDQGTPVVKVRLSICFKCFQWITGTVWHFGKCCYSCFCLMIPPSSVSVKYKARFTRW